MARNSNRKSIPMNKAAATARTTSTTEYVKSASQRAPLDGLHYRGEQQLPDGDVC